MSIARTMLTVLAWLLGVGATMALAAFVTPGTATGLLRLTVPCSSGHLAVDLPVRSALAPPLSR
ncbi:hypothetical protein AB0O67_29225 [Streptomyces sp. NPDC086077]|uniref:hypothetical protein n=1 Tax=Streptomyces sp. NPDC086077 TaxID=3154862 RepID=UPI003440ACB1